MIWTASSTQRALAVFGAGVAISACHHSEPGSFARIEGWGPLRWDMSPDAARHALDAAHVAHHSGWQRVYLSTPEPSDSNSFADHTSTQVIILEGSPSWSVTFDGCGTMQSVTRSGEDVELLPAAAKEHLDDLERRFGAPVWVDAGADAGEVRVWENASTRFRLWQGHDSTTGLVRVYEGYFPVTVTTHVQGAPCLSK